MRSRRRQEGETLPSLAQAITKLTLQAYPRLDISAREDLAVEQFVAAVDDRDVRMALHQQKPRTIMEATKVAVEMEAWKMAESKMEELQKPVRGRKCNIQKP